jgi:hypothetical protein
LSAATSQQAVNYCSIYSAFDEGALCKILFIMITLYSCLADMRMVRTVYNTDKQLHGANELPEINLLTPETLNV